MIPTRPERLLATSAEILFVVFAFAAACSGNSSPAGTVADSGANVDAGALPADAGKTDAGSLAADGGGASDAGAPDGGPSSPDAAATVDGGSLDAGANAGADAGVDAGFWATGVTVAFVGSDAGSYNSSTRLRATWNAPGAPVVSYVVSAAESIGPTTVSTETDSGTTVVLSGLKAATPYTVSVRACLVPGCASSLTASDAGGATTPTEVWMVMGDAGGFPWATAIVSDGSAKAHATRFGTDAGPSLAGKVQLYYDGDSAASKGVRIATTAAAATSSPFSVASFVAAGTSYGLQTPDGGANAGVPFKKFGTSQAIPLSPAMGGRMRVYAEIETNDNKARIYAFDSVDGYTGWDFNAGPSTVCDTYDYATDGGCAYQTAFPISGDDGGGQNLLAVRQFKIGFPTLTDWWWDGAPGTFMVFTFDTPASCSTKFFNIGYAVWDGGTWGVQYDGGAACPKMFQAMQAPMPVHLGGVNYKLYYSANNSDAGTFDPKLKPIRVIYADGMKTGSSSVVDFEDWESTATARPISVVWPHGTPVADSEMSFFDDYVVFMPTGDANLQVMVTNMSRIDAGGGAFIGAAYLVNP